jgi:hypothetical protein
MKNFSRSGRKGRGGRSFFPGGKEKEQELGLPILSFLCVTWRSLREEKNEEFLAQGAQRTLRKNFFSLTGGKELGFVHTFFPLRIGYTDYGYEAALMRDARLRIN